jgi:hypothetical protein
MEKIEDLLTQKALLESKVDLIEAELSYLNDLLVQCGFSGGIESLKVAANEVLKESRETL